ncbi:hypothetical protein [Nocardia sp. NBC_01388]|uniref:hypothetical protein n=1 Tax=Nocardia sp. NBC_01388 TaxID=2903596 RepID=UPI00325337F3
MAILHDERLTSDPSSVRFLRFLTALAIVAMFGVVSGGTLYLIIAIVKYGIQR